MPATLHVLAHYVAKPGKEDALKSVLVALVPPTRRELGCYQYDLLVDSADPRQFCFVERWDDEIALDQHLATNHVKKAVGQLDGLVEVAPEIRRYTLV
jgi:quinol monooxygenase YgiN